MGWLVCSEVSTFQRGLANISWLVSSQASCLHLPAKLHHYHPVISDVKVAGLLWRLLCLPPGSILLRSGLKVAKVGGAHTHTTISLLFSVKLGQLPCYALRHASHRGYCWCIGKWEVDMFSPSLYTAIASTKIISGLMLLGDAVWCTATHSKSLPPVLKC